MNCCRNCHFLAKSHVGPGGAVPRLTWNDKERSNCHIADHYSAECARGVWSTGVDPNLSSRLAKIIALDRKDDCFYIEYRKGMLFQAAIELHRLRYDNRNLKKSYRYTQIGLWVAALSLLATLVLDFLKTSGLLGE